MALKIKKTVDGEYTLQAKDKNGNTTLEIIPPKYSPIDKYGSYRRAAKKEIE
jgi:rRNA maturation protein Nop10